MTCAVHRSVTVTVCPGPSGRGVGLGPSDGPSGDDGHVDEFSQHRIQSLPQGAQPGDAVVMGCDI